MGYIGKSVLVKSVNSKKKVVFRLAILVSCDPKVVCTRKKKDYFGSCWFRNLEFYITDVWR